MPPPRNNDVIMEDNAERRNGIANHSRHFHIGFGRSRMITRVVMHYDDSGGVKFQCASSDFSWIHWRMIDSSPVLQLIGNEHIAPVEEQNAELLHGLVSHDTAQVFHQLVPGIENRAVADFLAC